MSKSTDPPALSVLPPRLAPIARRWAALLALLALVAGLGVVTTTAPAQAKAVPDSRCAAPDLGSGVCVADTQGGVHWLGTRRGYDGVELYCIDYLFATRWGVEHRRTVITGSLTTSLGKKVAPDTVAALSYLVTVHPADRASETTAAAISLIIRQVMGDFRRGSTQLMAAGLTVQRQVSDVAFVPDEIVGRAKALWNEARVHRGPWRLQAVLEAGPDGIVTPGERVDLVVRARNGSDGLQDAGVRLSYKGFTGPSSVRLGTDGAARLTLTAPPRPMDGSVTMSIDSAPSADPVVVVPNNWAVNPRPGHSSDVTQRGLIGRQVAVEARAWAKATIVKMTPTVTTVASAQRVEPGATLHDTVLVSGTGGAASSFDWSLLGPVQPLADGRCPGVGAAAWEGAAAIATGTVTTRGDGTYRTPGHTVTAAEVGCLTYVERLAETETTHPVTTPPGIAQETVLVAERTRSTPCVSTIASRQRGLVGEELFDRVSVGCITAGDRVEVAWTAHGPIAPATTGSNGCDRVSLSAWRKAPVRARGTFVASRAGTYSTTPFTVTRPGCYTFSESVAATATTTATSTPPGIAVETALFTRPPVPVVPVVPTGPSLLVGGSALRTATYAGRVQLWGLGVTARATKVGISNGSMVIPRDAGLLGWLRQSARPEDVVGSSVIAGHVTSPSGNPGALRPLGRAKPGTTLVWTDARGERHRYIVTTVQRYPRSRPLPAAIFRTDGPPVLRVITCTARVRGADGRYHYTKNLVVTARAVS